MLTIRCKLRRARWNVLAIPAALAMAGPLAAQTGDGIVGVRLSDGTALPLAQIATGEQLLLSDITAPVSFAGRQITLSGARVIAGYASEVAYLVVLEGEASIGKQGASAGRMLLIPPFGADVLVERFDAKRLGDQWPTSTTADGLDEARAALDKITRQQRLGLTLGRLQRTSFNVAASGAADQEAGRRALVGGETVRSIRFGGDANETEVAQRVVASTSDALASGDARALAELLDPIPFGTEDAGARIALAQSMLSEHDWPRQLASAQIETAGDLSSWRLRGPGGSTLIQLRASSGFPYVATINVEDGQ